MKFNYSPILKGLGLSKLSLFFLIGCGGNYHLTGENNTLNASSSINSSVVSLVNWNGGTTTSWTTDLTIKDSKGSILSQGLSKVDLKNCDTGDLFFSGTFNIGDDLSSVGNPVEVIGGSQTWSTDLQPYYSTPSLLENGKTLEFDKKAWAQAHGFYNHISDAPSGKPIKLCSEFSVKAPGDTGFSAVSSVTYDILNKHVFDNNTHHSDFPSGAFPFTANLFYSFGGIEYIENGTSLELTTTSAPCAGSSLNYILGTSTIFNHITAIRTKDSLAYIPNYTSGTDLNDALGNALGIDFEHTNSAAGVKCEDKYLSISRQRGYTLEAFSGFEVQNNATLPTNTIRYKIEILESF